MLGVNILFPSKKIFHCKWKYSQPKKINPSASVWYEVGFLWAKITYLKSAGILFFRIMQIHVAWGFQMSYFSLSYLKELQNYDLSKLDVQNSGVTLVRLESSESDLLCKM